MHLSAQEISLIRAELEPLLSGAQVQGVKKTSQGWILALRQPGQNWYLNLSFAPSQLWVSHEPVATQPADGSVQVLRHLTGQRLLSLTQSPLERLVQLHFSRGDTLHLELTGRHANGWLCNPEGGIQAQWRSDHSERHLRVGQGYQPPVLGTPPPQAQQDRLQLAGLAPDGSRSAALVNAQGQAEHQAEIHRLRQRITQAWKRYQAQIAADELRLESAETLGPRLRREAELLQGAYGHYVPGSSQITVIDYYDPAQAAVTLTLDPQSDLPSQIARRFAQARKQERTVTWLTEQLLARWEQQALWAAQVPEWLCQLETAPLTAVATSAQALLSTLPAHKEVTPQKPGERSPWHTFTAASGHALWVGRSAKDNQALLKSARGHDVWLHVQDHPGSHVLVKLARGESCPPQALLDAATLALHFSQARGQQEAAILYTPAKYVQRRKGAAPGEVYLQAHKVLGLRLEAGRLERLLKE
jgi:predicted ribosome quality control (RQC) complex YloA/Tae2 family protein